MATLYRWQNGITRWDAQDLNQIIDTFTSQFGIVDSAQDALGRLIVPRPTSNPGSPTPGQIWFRPDQDVGGRLYVRGNDAQNIIYQPLRQIGAVSTLNADASVSGSDTNVLSPQITTTGGLVFIIASAAISGTRDGTGNGVARLTTFLKRDITHLQRFDNDIGTFASQTFTAMNSFVFVDNPGAPGTYTYNLGGAVNSGAVAWSSGKMLGNANDAVARCRIRLIEIGSYI